MPSIIFKCKKSTIFGDLWRICDNDPVLHYRLYSVEAVATVRHEGWSCASK